MSFFMLMHTFYEMVQSTKTPPKKKGDESPAVDDGKVEDLAECPPVSLDEDTFGMTVCSLIRDSYFMSCEGATRARVIRVIASLFLVALTIFLQVFLLIQLQQFVTAGAVHQIRNVYDAYEVAMYGNHTTLTVNGKHRGIDGFMPDLAHAEKILSSLPTKLQDKVCKIPLSQPAFFAVILLIWTLTCVMELKKATSLQSQIIMLKTVPSMSEAMREGDDEGTTADGIISGMTLPLKL